MRWWSKDYARAAEVLDVIGTRLIEIPPTSIPGSLPAGLVGVALPGHSPGHTGYRIDAGDSAVLFVGDLLHFPDLQGRCPRVSVRPDIDAGLAAKTRRDVLKRAAATGTLLAGAHLGPQGFRRVSATKDGTQLI